MTEHSTSETERIRREYERRDRDLAADYYALTRPVNLFFQQGKERALCKALYRQKLAPLADKRILDVGCGHGNWLATLEAFGTKRELLAAVELDATRAESAARRFTGADIRHGNAAELPWDDQSFDIVLQSMVFTSILDPAVRRQVAQEMQRVLAPGGAIVWYDFLFDNPNNPSVRAVKKSELAELFPGCRLSLSRITLAPPLARRIVPISWPLASLLEKLWLLNTHYLGTIRPANA